MRSTTNSFLLLTKVKRLRNLEPLLFRRLRCRKIKTIAYAAAH
ncbi:unnamed protein product [Rodentolepis nana]|uniref:Uncharacterized protein n=1 Tax=Rodentolepis nana TaxID=102285 RepID=A0A3P7SHL1_RODNA|nr:unnamed protein product [Rodentolepis nana]